MFPLRVPSHLLHGPHRFCGATHRWRYGRLALAVEREISAPEEYVGRRIDCPRCANRLLLRTPGEEREAAVADEERDRRLEADREKLALLEKLEERSERPPRRERGDRASSRVRHYDPDAPSRFFRLRALADLAILGAYFALFTSLAGAGVTAAALWEEGWGWAAAAAAAWLLVAAVLFLALKLAGEFCFVLADLADAQGGAVDLLQDVRESMDRLEE